MTKCIKCGEEATVRLSPDLDIEGFSICEEHKVEVRHDLALAYVTGNWKRFNKKYNIKNNKK